MDKPKVMIIGSSQLVDKMKRHKEGLEKNGFEVRLPILDYTIKDNSFNGEYTDYEISWINRDNIKWADFVHILWDRRSIGTIFDFGMAFALGKNIRIIYLSDKTFEGIMKKYEKICQQDSH